MNIRRLLKKALRYERQFQVGVVALAVATLAVQFLVMFRQAAAGAEVHRQPGRPAAAYSGFMSLDRRGIAERLVDAVIQVESGGRDRMVGKAGERGLMQIKRVTWMHTTRRLYGRPVPFARAFDPELNRRIGSAYLDELQSFLHQHRASWRSDERSLLLACFNAGPERVRRAGFDVRRLPRAVRSYVDRATALHEYYLAEEAPFVRSLLLAQAGDVGVPAGS